MVLYPICFVHFMVWQFVAYAMSWGRESKLVFEASVSNSPSLEPDFRFIYGGVWGFV